MSSNYMEHPELYPWVDPAWSAEREAQVLNAEAQHEQEMAACLCDYDGGYGDDGRDWRRTPHKDCPVHRDEDREDDDENEDINQ